MPQEVVYPSLLLYFYSLLYESLCISSDDSLTSSAFQGLPANHIYTIGCLDDFWMLLAQCCMLMRSGVLQKSLPAQWQSSIAVKLSTEVSRLLLLTRVLEMGQTRNGTPDSLRIFALSTSNKDHIVALLKPDLHTNAEAIASRFPGEQVVFLAVPFVPEMGQWKQNWDTCV